MLKKAKTFNFFTRRDFSMPDSRCSCNGPSIPKESICIDTYRVLDSCRDKDCFEDTMVYLTDFGKEIIERTTAVRAKSACVVYANISVDPISFNRGFYQINIKIYVKLRFEACVCRGSSQEFEGIAVVEKKVILYGSEGNVNIYKSNAEENFCKIPDLSHAECSSNTPRAVLEIADPIVLGVKIEHEHHHHGCCCCCASDIPEHVCACLTAPINDSECQRILTVSLGFFSVVRMERPAQILISGCEYSVPDKECVISEDESPCSIFKNMQFPINEFSPPSLSSIIKDKCK